MNKDLLKRIISESARRSLSHVYEKINGCPIAIMTASLTTDYNGNPISTETNNDRNEKLGIEIQLGGYGYFPVRGRSIEKHADGTQTVVDERSFVIVGPPDDEATFKQKVLDWGKEWGQNSVVFKSKDSENADLIGTKKGGYPGMGVVEDIGQFTPDGTVHQFHTVMRRGGEPDKYAPKTAKTPQTKPTPRTFAFAKKDAVKTTTGSNQKAPERGGGSPEDERRVPKGQPGGGRWTK